MPTLTYYFFLFNIQTFQGRVYTALQTFFVTSRRRWTTKLVTYRFHFRILLQAIFTSEKKKIHVRSKRPMTISTVNFNQGFSLVTPVGFNQTIIFQGLTNRLSI